MHKRTPLFAMMLLLATTARCEKTKAMKEQPKTATKAPYKEITMGTLTVTSPAFQPGRPIPKQHAYTGEGENLSPPLAWSGAPEGTRSYAIICDDPDAPSAKNPRPDPWVHWVVYNIPAKQTAIAEGNAGTGTMGSTDFKQTSWGGPLPPPGSGPHRYVFKVYALDTTLSLSPGASKPQLLQAMQGHILAQGELFGTYQRK